MINYYLRYDTIKEMTGMEGNTTVGWGIDSADIGAQYEVACKHLLSEKAIPARIMKECL